MALCQNCYRSQVDVFNVCDLYGKNSIWCSPCYIRYLRNEEIIAKICIYMLLIMLVIPLFMAGLVLWLEKLYQLCFVVVTGGTLAIFCFYRGFMLGESEI